MPIKTQAQACLFPLFYLHFKLDISFKNTDYLFSSLFDNKSEDTFLVLGTVGITIIHIC